MLARNYNSATAGNDPGRDARLNEVELHSTASYIVLLVQRNSARLHGAG
jgi:hypothetical protein